ncbi:hypothetical protein L931_04425 [Helicobacter pylori PZ5024]|uniref:Uncharacterized protein n=1 Tax=Helicobacter pylori PZ5024 TaxID=1337391 RepID=T2T0U8_HELPX|nr:hypothetical protein L931_04425 [Helicobacter pylori PZ5024]
MVIKNQSPRNGLIESPLAPNDKRKEINPLSPDETNPLKRNN